MPLPRAVAGGGHGGMLITCTRPDGTVIDLTNATGVTGRIINQADGSSRAIAGSLAVSGWPTAGTVVWTFDAADLVTGNYLVQLTITFSSGLPARNFAEPWVVERGY